MIRFAHLSPEALECALERALDLGDPDFPLTTTVLACQDGGVLCDDQGCQRKARGEACCPQNTDRMVPPLVEFHDVTRPGLGVLNLDACARENDGPCGECGRHKTHDGACPVFDLLYPRTAEHFRRLGLVEGPREQGVSTDALGFAQDGGEADPEEDAEHFRGSEHEDYWPDLPERDGP